MADEKVTKAPVDNTVEVKLVAGEIDHTVHFENFRVEFTNGVAKVEKAVEKLLKEIGVIK